MRCTINVLHQSTACRYLHYINLSYSGQATTTGNNEAFTTTPLQHTLEMCERIPALLPAVDGGDPKWSLLKIQFKFNQSFKTFGLLKGKFEYRR